MNINKEKHIMNVLKDRYETLQKDYEVLGIFLIGSQNYMLDTEESDIDVKAIILPKFKDFLLNSKPVSTTIVLENNEHIDLKDVRLIFECYKKQNINFIETLFTKSNIINPKYAKEFKPMIENNEKVARYNIFATLNCIKGMSMEKKKALCHPYPSKIEIIEEHGYDGKQLHHILRMAEFVTRYIAGERYSDCLISKGGKDLVAIKKHILPKHIAMEMANEYDKKVKDIVELYMKNATCNLDKEVEEIMNNVLTECMKKNFIEELRA